MKTVNMLTTIALISILFALVGCSNAQTPPPPAPEEPPAATSEPVAEQPESAAKPEVAEPASGETIKIALVPDPEDDYSPLINWLGQETGVKFVMVGVQDYEQSVNLLANGEVDLAFMGAGSLIAAQKQEPEVRMLATYSYWSEELEEMIDSYTSMIITLKTRDDVNSLQDLAGMKFGFVAEDSTSGFRVPYIMLRDQEIDYETYFDEFFFVGNHAGVADAVVAESIDAGTIASDLLPLSIESHGDVFKVIAESTPIPGPGIAVHPSVQAELQTKIQEALVRADPMLFEATAADGFVIRPDSFYDVTRQIEALKAEQ